MTRDTIHAEDLARLQCERHIADHCFRAVSSHQSGKLERHELSRAYFDTLIDAREFDLTDEPPATLAAMVSYAEGTTSTLIRLALESLGQRAGAAHDAAQGIGVAWGLTGLLRAAVFHARDKRQYLPAQLMREAAADPVDLFERRGGASLAVEMFAWSDRNHGAPLAEAFHTPGREILRAEGA